MARLRCDRVLAEKFNPLEDGPLPEDIPLQWHGGHVGLRYRDAFETLARLPRGPWGPRDVHSRWPEFSDQWCDVLAQLSGGADGAEVTWQRRNRVYVRPSSIEIAQMEAALGWPMHYLGGRDDMITALNLTALAHAQDRELDDVLMHHKRRRRERLPLPRMSEAAVRRMSG